MTAPDLGRLTRVDIRSIWRNESADFTPWLARPENIQLLGDTIGLELEVESVEKKVGRYFADILCKETSSDRYVVVENQIERTDHDHLGKTITHAAGLGATAVVWVAWSTGELRVDLNIHDGTVDATWAALRAQQAEIESELAALIPEKPTWYRKEGVCSCRVYVRFAADVLDRQRWSECRDWLRTRVEALDKVFRPRGERLGNDA